MTEARLESAEAPWRGLAAALVRRDVTRGIASEGLVRLLEDLERHFHAHGPLRLHRAGPFLLVDGARVPAGGDRAAAQRLATALARWGLDGMQLDPGLRLDELVTLLQLLAAPHDPTALWPGAGARLRDLGVAHVQVQAAAPSPAAQRRPALLRVHRDQAQRAWVGALERTAAVERGGGQEPSLGDLKRCVQRLVDVLQEDGDTVLLGLASARSVTLSAYGAVSTHAVNVAVLALVLGRAAGLGKRDLARLGLVALLHDAGTEPGPAQTDAAGHTLHGATRLLGLGRLDEVAQLALTALEHHGAAGLPCLDGLEATVATRMVQIADAYELLRRGSAQRPALPADRALAALRGGAGVRLDAELVQVFATALGPHPPGSAVQLDSGEIGVVVRAPRDASLADRPLVRLLLDAAGQPFPAEVLADLAEDEPGGRSAPRVAAGVDPDSHGIVPAALFLDFA